MTLGIAAELSAPPSSPTCFRDVLLFGKVFRGYDVIVITPEGMLDVYVKWMRRHGQMDFVDDVLPREQVGSMEREIEGGPGTWITAHNLHRILSAL